MWLADLYMFVCIWMAISTGQLITVIPLSVIYIWLLNMRENLNGIDYHTERPSSHDNHSDNWILDDTDNNLDNTKG